MNLAATSAPVLNHVSLAVPKLELAIEFYELLGAQVGATETFRAESTREVYIGASPCRLLLQQPVGKAGPVAEFMSRFGAGLHHIALDVVNLEDFAATLRGSGWLLTPSSLESAQRNRLIWLGRPGVGSLVEVTERSHSSSSDDLDGFVSEVGMSVTDERIGRRLVSGLTRGAGSVQVQKRFGIRSVRAALGNASVSMWIREECTTTDEIILGRNSTTVPYAKVRALDERAVRRWKNRFRIHELRDLSNFGRNRRTLYVSPVGVGGVLIELEVASERPT